MNETFEKRKLRIKKVRDKFLRFHKVLMDRERENYESEYGVVSPGQFLELLLGDQRFAWLRILSTLIVRIDEAFDLDDGISIEMVDGFFEESRNLFDDTDEYREFKEKLESSLAINSEAVTLKLEIETLLG